MKCGGATIHSLTKKTKKRKKKNWKEKNEIKCCARIINLRLGNGNLSRCFPSDFYWQDRRAHFAHRAHTHTPTLVHIFFPINVSRLSLFRCLSAWKDITDPNMGNVNAGTHSLTHTSGRPDQPSSLFQLQSFGANRMQDIEMFVCSLKSAATSKPNEPPYIPFKWPFWTVVWSAQSVSYRMPKHTLNYVVPTILHSLSYVSQMLLHPLHCKSSAVFLITSN